MQAARLEVENAKAEAAELRRSLETKAIVKDAECPEQAATQVLTAINSYSKPPTSRK